MTKTLKNIRPYTQVLKSHEYTQPLSAISHAPN